MSMQKKISEFGYYIKKMVDFPRPEITAVKLHRGNGSCLWMVMIGLNQICARPCIVPEKKNRYSLLCVAL